RGRRRRRRQRRGRRRRPRAASDGAWIRVYAESGPGDHKAEPLPYRAVRAGGEGRASRSAAPADRLLELRVRAGDDVRVVEPAVGEHPPAGELVLEGEGERGREARLGRQDGQVAATDAPPTRPVLQDRLVEVGGGVGAVLGHREAE